jgi:MFS transporter, MHS family, shikimate and dehydroshikimate transport protein
MKIQQQAVSDSRAESDEKKASMRTVVAASAIGTTIEWYDFLIYSTAASLVLNKIFFPTRDPLVSKLLAIGTIGVGFFVRPLGAIILSHFGDRMGRKSMLVLTLVSMGVGTMLIGLLPTYEIIGVAAPILLVACRSVQGIAVGGEWGGAVLMAIEHSPVHRRGFYERAQISLHYRNAESTLQTSFAIGCGMHITVRSHNRCEVDNGIPSLPR